MLRLVILAALLAGVTGCGSAPSTSAPHKEEKKGGSSAGKPDAGHDEKKTPSDKKPDAGHDEKPGSGHGKSSGK